MRRLSVKQKKVIQEYYERANREFRPFGEYRTEILQKLEQINDYETLWSDFDRLSWDLLGTEFFGLEDKNNNYKEVIKNFN